jgi:hypothetical protein
MGQFIGKTIIEGGQGRTIKKYDLNNIVGRPTGQGYGKAWTSNKGTNRSCIRCRVSTR